MNPLDLNTRAERIAAERFLERTKAYPKELQPDILANDPVLHDEVAQLARLERRLDNVPFEPGTYRAELHAWLHGEGELTNARYVPLPDIYGSITWMEPDEDTGSLPILIDEIFGDKGHRLARYAYPQVEPIPMIDTDLIDEFRYVRATHRFLTVLQRLHRLPQDVNEAVATLQRLGCVDAFDGDDVLPLFRGWYYDASDDPRDPPAILSFMDDDDAAKILSELAVAFSDLFVTYAEQL